MSRETMRAICAAMRSLRSGTPETLADLSLARPFLASDDELLREQAEWAVARIEERHVGRPLG